MSRIRKCLVWYAMCTKRLLKKWSFIVLICLIPVMVPLLHGAMLSNDSGILEVALCNQDNDAVTGRIIENLLNDNGIIKYRISDSYEESRELVDNGEVDAAWVFVTDMGKKVENFASGKSYLPIVKIIEQEDTISLKLSREILYGAMYPELSYSLYENYIFEDMGLEGRVTEEKLRQRYDIEIRGNDIIKQTTLNDEVEPVEENLLTAPVRGILALLVVLCTIAAVMYFLKDQQENRFSYMPPGKRIIPAFATCLSASVIAGVTVLITLQVSGLSVGFLRELTAMSVFVFTTTGFCLVLCTIFRSPGKLGAALPGIIIGMLIFAPVFFNIVEMQAICNLFPLNYYMCSVYDSSYFIYSLIYGTITYMLAILLNLVFRRA